jgi:hypothetical protein
MNEIATRDTKIQTRHGEHIQVTDVKTVNTPFCEHGVIITAAVEISGGSLIFQKEVTFVNRKSQRNYNNNSKTTARTNYCKFSATINNHVACNVGLIVRRYVEHFSIFHSQRPTHQFCCQHKRKKCVKLKITHKISRSYSPSMNDVDHNYNNKAHD